MNQSRNSANASASAWAQFGLRPLSARSALASVLLGTDPPELPTGALVRLCGRLGITEGTTRVALSRMVSAGELEGSAAGHGGYRLVGPGLLARRELQEQARRPLPGDWDGSWHLMVVAGSARPVAERNEVRRALADARLAEWREGVWLRPANLPRPRDDVLTGASYQWLQARPEEDPVRLAGELWPLGDWAARGRELLQIHAAGADGDAVFTFAAAAALLRHLRADPLLPSELLPARWPGQELRRAYSVAVAGVTKLLRVS
jgi:phenylacetic acid degradation operon negative regulatory protein